jgi:adenylyl cyclase-associated protein
MGKEEGEEGDSRECPVPEQVRTWIDGEGKVVSEIVEHAG